MNCFIRKKKLTELTSQSKLETSKDTVFLIGQCKSSCFAFVSFYETFHGIISESAVHIKFTRYFKVMSWSDKGIRQYLKLSKSSKGYQWYLKGQDKYWTKDRFVHFTWMPYMCDLNMLVLSSNQSALLFVPNFEPVCPLSVAVTLSGLIVWMFWVLCVFLIGCLPVKQTRCTVLYIQIKREY